VSFFRQTDRTLLAGDAFVTVKQESLKAVFTQKQELHGPPMYYTPDWPAALASIALLADLEPEFAATGHGIPMHGEFLREQLRDLLAEFDRLILPTRGRYLQHPAVTDENGIVSLPPPVVNPVPKVLAAGLAVLTIAFILRNRRARST
jgi:hypothetical protein